MRPEDRVERWLEDLRVVLCTAAELVARGRDEFDTDPALPLAFEALTNRIGDIARRLISAGPERFADPIWRQAARNRDFVVHHDDRLDADVLWSTVTLSFPLLKEAADQV